MSSKIGNIRILSCGYCRQLERLVSKKGLWKSVRFYARCYLIPIQEGFLLFDTGYAADTNQIMNYFPALLYKTLIPISILPTETAFSQITRLGIKIEDIKYVFISHFHADHISALRDFPQAKFICSKEEYFTLKKLPKFKQICRGFISEFLPDDFEQRALFINKNKVQEMRGLQVYELDNLPNIYAVSLPGHTKVQLGLFLKEEKILLAADAAWRRSNLNSDGYPSMLALQMCEDKKEYLKTLSKLAALTDINILFTHEEE
ncbi:MAG: MBL fold metallo-hydrolase [Elusimicrobiaceae bacterium]|nr:MBL fold metallo-hydrolase [Elusimicrobiaceae bacterium]